MEYVIEIIIYLISVFGIVITTMSFYEMFSIKKKVDDSYRIFSKLSDNEKKVNVIFKIVGFNEIEEKELINILNKDTKLKEISNNIIIQKEDY